MEAAASLKRDKPQQLLYLQVAEQIQQFINNGDLSPADQLLSERELAEKFGVSRTSIRNALAFMHGRGLIEINPRDGAYVRQLNFEDAKDVLHQALFQKREQVVHLFEVRQIIETQAACLAAERRTTLDLHRLRTLNRQFEADLDHGDIAFEANTRFHLAIVDTARNPLLAEIMTPLLTSMIEVYKTIRYQSLINTSDLSKFADEHDEIIEALAQQDQQLVTTLLGSHIDGARQRVEAIMGGAAV